MRTEGGETQLAPSSASSLEFSKLNDVLTNVLQKNLRTAVPTNVLQNNLRTEVPTNVLQNNLRTEVSTNVLQGHADFLYLYM